MNELYFLRFWDLRAQKLYIERWWTWYLKWKVFWVIFLTDADNVLEGTWLRDLRFIRRTVLSSRLGLSLCRWSMTSSRLLWRGSRSGQSNVSRIRGQSEQVLIEVVGGLRVVEAEADSARVVGGEVHGVEGSALSRVLGQVVHHVGPEDEPGPLLYEDQLNLSFGSWFGVAWILKKAWNTLIYYRTCS